MKKRQWIILFVIPVTCLFITSCKPSENKLLTADKKQAGQFLYKAEIYAASKTHFYDMMGSVYINCIQNPSHYDNPFNKNTKNPCENFLKSMASYAKESSRFNDVTLNNLKDPAVAKRLADTLISYESTNGQSSQI